MSGKREAELYDPIAEYLRKLGYEVRGEVKHLDLVAHRDGELIGVELKRTMSLDLLGQAVERQRATDGVYVAVRARDQGPPIRNMRRVHALLRRLELGLILVHFRPSGTRIEVRFHPSRYQHRRSHRTREGILRELNGRTGDRNTGGVSQTPVITAYREQAVHIACALTEIGPASPAALRALGTCERTGRILLRNVYGWFEHLDKGLYGIHEAGRRALTHYPDLTAHYTKLVASKLQESRK